MADKALDDGESLVNDVAESNVIRGVQNQDKGYTKLWLTHRHEKFKKKLEPRERKFRDTVVFDPAKRQATLDKWFLSGTAIRAVKKEPAGEKPKEGKAT